MVPIYRHYKIVGSQGNEARFWTLVNKSSSLMKRPPASEFQGKLWSFSAKAFALCFYYLYNHKFCVMVTSKFCIPYLHVFSFIY